MMPSHCNRAVYRASILFVTKQNVSIAPSKDEVSKAGIECLVRFVCFTFAYFHHIVPDLNQNDANYRVCYLGSVTRANTTGQIFIYLVYS